MASDRMSPWLARILLFLGVSCALPLTFALKLQFQVDPKWIKVTMFSAGIFGLAINETRENWVYARYWFIALLCLMLHCGLVLLLWSALPEVPIFLLVIFSTAESAGIFWWLLNIDK